MIGYTKNKIMAFLLAVFLLAGLVPTAVFAEEAPTALTEAPETAAADEPGEKPMPLTEEPDEEPAAEQDSVQPAAEPQTDERIRVVVVSEIEDLRVTVYPAPTEETPEPEAIEPEEDGSWLLAAGDYVYSAEAEGYLPLDKVAFTLTAEGASVYKISPEMTAVSEHVEPAAEESVIAEESETVEAAAPVGRTADADTSSAAEPSFDQLRAPSAEPLQSASVVDSGTVGENVTWTLTDDGTLTISGEGEIPDQSSIGAPWHKHKSSITHIVIENGITRIGSYAFYYCDSAIDVTMANSVTAIGNEAFRYCSALESVKLPASLSSLAVDAFQGCGSLQAIDVEAGSESFRSVDGVLYSKDMKTLVAFPGGRTGAFTVPEGVETIGDSSFRESSLSEVTLPSSVKTIGSHAFYYSNNLSTINLPEGLTAIGTYAFDHSALREVTIPETLTDIGEDAFSNCFGLFKVTFRGDHTIERYVFSKCTALKTIEVENGKLTLSYVAFGYCEGLDTLVLGEQYNTIDGSAFLNCSNLRNIVIEEGNGNISKTAFSGCSIEQIAVKGSVDELFCSDFEAFDYPNTTLRDPLFEHAENHFSYTGNDFKAGRLPLTEGDYYVDEQGVVYLLRDDGTASLVYASPDFDAEIYKIPETVPSEDGETNYRVTEIGYEAFKTCEGLRELIIPDSVSKIGVWSFAYCGNLAKVNGKTALQDVLDDWADSGATATSFVDTALTGSAMTVVTEPIVLFTADEHSETQDKRRLVKLTTAKTAALTGETVTTSLEIDGGNDDSESVVRVYFQFEDEHGMLNEKYDGTQVFDGIEVEFCKASVPNVYYYEVRPLKAGETLALDVSTVYENIVSGGGKALIWPSVMTKEEAESFGNAVTTPEKAHLVTWTTQPDTFPVTKSSYSNYSFYSDGSDEGGVSLSSFEFEIKMSREGDTQTYGKDLMRSVTMEDTLILPEQFYWRSEVLQAIREGDYTMTTSVTKDVIYGYYDHVYFNIHLNGQTINPIELTEPRTSPNNTSVLSLSGQGLRVDENDRIVVSWTLRNLSSDQEMNARNVRMKIGQNALMLNTDQISREVEAAGRSVKYEFTNNVKAIQHFSHSADQTQEASCSRQVEIGEAELSITKYALSGSRMGEDGGYIFYLSNNKPLPLTTLKTVYDYIPSEDYYIAPGDMETMFYDDEFGSRLSITISNATLYSPVSHAVTGTDGQTYTITQQFEGVNTPHSGKSPMNTDTVVDSNAKLTISWAEDGEHLQLTVESNGATNTYTIGAGCSYPSIKAALDGIGYLVTLNSSYKCEWDMQGLKLNCGQKLTFNVRSTIKDTFMRLVGDQDWFLFDGDRYHDNRNYAYGSLLSGKTSSDYASRYTYRDFTLFKDAFWNGELITDEIALDVGEVITYTNQVTHTASNSYAALPLIDHMEGAQVLLVSVEDNASLADQGLETMEADGVQVYLLNKPGTYRNVKVGTHLADEVVISSVSGGLDTMIDWYLTGIKGNVVEEVSYQSLFSPEKAGIDADVCTFRLSNEVWLNDHQTHRLYDRAFVKGSILKMNKYIVTNLDPAAELSGHDPSMDELTTSSKVHEGETVVYRLLLEGTGDGVVTINGSSLWDELPASQNGYWSKDNVSITYVPAAGTVTVSDESADAWTIENDTEDASRQTIRWNRDFTVTLDQGTLYLYVKLTFPSGSAWSDYGHQYGNGTVINTFHVDQLYASVIHYLSIPAQVLLQKGVLESGAIPLTFGRIPYLYNTDEDALWYYRNDAQDHGLVCYYVTIYNSGDTRVYLTDLQDTLPEGFTFYGLFFAESMVSSSWSGYLSYSSPTSSLSAIETEDGTPFVYKQVYLTAAPSEAQDGRQTVRFSISEYLSASGNKMISYDKDRGLCYLNKGEAVVFAYYCQTNKFTETKDVATNVIAMPYYDYNGAGAHIDEQTSVSRSRLDNQLSNDGNRYLMTSAQASQLGMELTHADAATEWLASDVTVYRGDILPGITKRAEKSFASPTDTINWTVLASNGGKEVMRGYTFTDTMMAPYQFCGDVGYQINYENNSAYYSQNPKLFSFDSRQPGDETIRITSQKPSTSYEYLVPVDTILSVNGEPQPVKTHLVTKAGDTVYNIPLTIYVSLSRDTETQKETLTINFPAEQEYNAGISHEYYAALSLQTANYTGQYTNATFVNTCYLTPSENQPFDTTAVSRGNYTQLNEKDSVVSDAAVDVAYGYATAASKAVTELSNPENTAKSTDSMNYIALSDRESTFRYTLTVNNSGGTAGSHAMSKLVLIDSLPQVGDHVPFYTEIPRYSEFQVNFAETSAFELRVNDTAVPADTYYLQFSTATEFDTSDWSALDASGWYTMDQIAESSELSLNKMRSFRVFVDDPDGTLIPADAVITVGFNANVDGNPDQGLTAWNSFGYHYKLLGVISELEAAPMKVGVRIASIPKLVKELKDVHGEAYQAAEDVSFRFLICEGEALELPDNWTESDLQTALGTRKFLIAERTVPAGSSTSEALVLDGQKVWMIEGGAFTATNEDWSWVRQNYYTVIELPGDGHYSFKAFNKIRPNNYTFRYLPETQVILNAVNIREVWDIKVLKLRQQDNEALPGAVFGLYSKTAADKMEDAAYETAAADLDKAPARELTVSEQTWYLRDIRTTGDDGTILWTGLEGDGYYVLELQAPEHYKLSENPGQIVNKSDSSDHVAIVTAINAPTKELIIRKVVEGEGAPHLQFTFVLNMKDVDGNPVAGSFCGQTFDNEGNLEFKLKAGDKIRLAEIPDGYQYKVTEKDVPTNFHVMQAEYEGVMQVEVAAIEVEFTNVYGYVTYELPSGGGSGTYPFTVAGVAVLTTALFLMIRGKRKERV